MWSLVTQNSAERNLNMLKADLKDRWVEIAQGHHINTDKDIAAYTTVMPGEYPESIQNIS